MPNKLPRLLFAGTHSGVGKTTLVTALLRYWTLQKQVVQPYKVGPDYIDPGFHTAATMRVARNLDAWLLSPAQIKRSFLQNAMDADLSIIEGVMGLYDGASPLNDKGSTAEIAKLLKTPVVLVVDGAAMARSAAAVVKGFQLLDKKVDLAGVIFNHVNTAGHYQLLKKAVEKECRIRCYGFLPQKPEFVLPEKHLGLVPVEAATPRFRKWFALIAKEVPKQLDVPGLLKLARSAPQLKIKPPKSRAKTKLVCRIAYARDEAFHFYYPDNIELLEAFGAEMVPFSPIYDQALPEADAIYFGGGFPENYVKDIASNRKMLTRIRQAIDKGMPVYAECGGLMLLCDTLVLQNKKPYKMVGAIPGKVVMTPFLQNFGYTYIEALRENLLLKKGETVRGHEFHYSFLKGVKPGAPAYKTKKVGKDLVSREGFCRKNLLASYVHIHFAAKPACAKNFIQHALAYKRKR